MNSHADTLQPGPAPLVVWFATLWLAMHPVCALAAPQSTAFTYQAELKHDGVLVTGLPDLEFRLFDGMLQGNQIGVAIVAADYPVQAGRLTVDLDFGAGAFVAQARYLEILVDGVVLTPRQRLSSAPFANRALAVADNGVTGNAIVDGAVAANDVDASTVQLRIGSACAAGSSIRAVDQTGTVTCEPDDLGDGDITAVAAGAGLSGGGDSGQLALAIANAGVIGAMLAPGAIGTTAIADGAVGSTQIANGSVAGVDINSAQIQTRVAGACAVGSSIRQINADGSVLCADALPGAVSAPRPPFSRANLDLTGQMRDISLTLGVDGLGLISWYDTVGKDLHVAHCSDIACSTVTDTTIDSGGDVGETSSIAIGANGLGIVSYYDRDNGDLKFAACSDLHCSSATTMTLDTGTATGEDVGRASSLTLSSDGRPAMSYYDVTRGDLKLAICGSPVAPFCGSKTLLTSDSGGSSDVGRANKLILAPEGATVKFYIAYYDATAGDLKLARCFENGCGAPAIAVIDALGDAGGVLALMTSADAGALIAYITVNGANQELHTAHCDNLPCSTLTKTLIFSGAINVSDLQLLLAGDGAPVIIPLIAGAGANFLRCKDAACTSTVGVGLNSGNLLLAESSPFGVTLGADGFALFATRRAGGSGNLNILHCSDHLCVPYRRR